jgi:hypothetical protein
MISVLTLSWPWRILFILLLLGLLVCICSGQDPGRFAEKRTVEADGSTSFCEYK